MRDLPRKLTLLTLSTLTVMSGATIAPTLPGIASAYGVTGTLARTILTAPALAIALLAPLSGLALDRLGRMPVLLAGLALYVVAGTAGLWLPTAWTVWPLLASRVLLGVAVAGVMTATTTLIGDYYDGPERGKLLGWQGAFMAGGGLTFLLAGGGLGEWSWRGPFAVYAAAGLMLPAAWRLLSEPNVAAATPSSSPGAAPARTRHWPIVAAVYATALLGMLLFYLVPTQYPFHLAALGVGGSFASGLVIALSGPGQVLLNPQFGRLRGRLGIAGVVALLFGLMASGFVMTWLAGGLGAMIAASVVLGLGVGLLMPATSGWLLDVAPPASRGKLIGGLTSALFLGQFLSPFASGPLVTAIGSARTFLAAGIASGVTAVVFVVAAGRRRLAYRSA